MSREIEQDRIDSGDLTYAEACYLRDRGKLPADYEMPESDEEEVEKTVPTTNYTPLEQQSVPKMERAGGIVEEDYEEGWNNPSRRAELSKRGLSIDGTKEVLVSRLRRSDTDQLEDDDYNEVS
jgi:SAP domain